MRTVIEAISVSEKIDAELAIYPRLEQAYDALTWWLARNPTSGKCIDAQYHAYKQGGNRRLNIPALVALYTFTAHEVEIVSILIKLPEL